jgi:sulfofructose kinase
VTAGARACSGSTTARGRAPPGHAIAAVDTLGPGDIFHAAFALALAEGRGEADATRFGNAAAALKCARPGGGAGAPTRGEVETFLREQGQ